MINKNKSKFNFSIQEVSELKEIENENGISSKLK